jgi:carbon-monoxide dehydrogenase small subunit
MTCARKPIRTSVNGAAIEAQVEPRTHLADFLRDQLQLTGTHLSCEHGVCGACTLLVDDKPVRSCLAFAIQCDGKSVTTIEGLDDEVMRRLREAFSREHALQCGYCTPGMLMTARDIVLRRPDADEATVRIELSGNLCRCTGYVGIVKAVMSVLADVKAQPIAQIDAKRPRGAAPVAVAPSVAFSVKSALSRKPSPPAALTEQLAADVAESRKGWQRIDEAFEVDFAPAEVWRVLSDIPVVANCLPGLDLVEFNGNTAKGRMNLKFGPMTASLGGAGVIDRDDRNRTGTLEGGGVDALTKSRAKGVIRYAATPLDDGARTRVSIVLEYNLQGPLAQFSRSGLVKDFVARLAGEFSKNLEARLSGRERTAGAPELLDAGSLFWGVLRARLKRLLRMG